MKTFQSTETLNLGGDVYAQCFDEWRTRLYFDEMHPYRREAGDPRDTAGYYYNWSSGTSIEAVVEGHYGVKAVPGGVQLDPKNCEPGNGINKVVIPGGFISYRRLSQPIHLIELNTERNGDLHFIIPDNVSNQIKVIIDDREAQIITNKHRSIMIRYLSANHLIRIEIL